MTTHETAREVWSNRKSGAARMALMLEGDPNLDQGGWRVWIELATGGTIEGDDAIVDALVDAGVDADAARTAVEEGRFAALGDPESVAAQLQGMYYRSAEAQRIAASIDWDNEWPEIDGDGVFTGRVVGSEEGYANVDDDAVIEIGVARAAGWDIEDGAAYPPQSLTDAHRHDADGPMQVWERYVGGQSPSQFMRQSPGLTPEQAVAEYRNGHPFFADLNAEQADQVARTLIEHIRHQTA